MTIKSPDYVITRTKECAAYGLWRLKLDAPELLERVDVSANTQFADERQITPIGSYILEWGPSGDIQNSLVYKLWSFDPDSPTDKDPLGGTPVSQWYWSTEKFTRGRLDFGHFGDRYNRHLNAGVMEFVPFGSCMLAWIPEAGRGTFRLWNFDPQSADPLPEPICPESPSAGSSSGTGSSRCATT